jgi:hypothetical protein
MTMLIDMRQDEGKFLNYFGMSVQSFDELTMKTESQIPVLVIFLLWIPQIMSHFHSCN